MKLGRIARAVGKSMFGLAAAGQEGVAKALTILQEETSRTLAMLGCTRIDQLSRELLQVP